MERVRGESGGVRNDTGGVRNTEGGSSIMDGGGPRPTPGPKGGTGGGSNVMMFPFEKVREGQGELIKAVEDSLSSGKHLVAHAPTGLGKTAAVLSPGLSYAVEHDKKLFFLTSRHTQHRIAVDTLSAIKSRFGGDFSPVVGLYILICVDIVIQIS